MKLKVLLVLLTASAVIASAQTTPKPAAPAATAKPATKSTTASTAAKLPPGVPVVRGIKKTAFALQYVDVKLGTGALAEQHKMYKVQYTGYLASTGYKFDSSLERRTPVVGKDGKPTMGPDGKPVLGDPHPEPFSFPQGFGRLIPGWDQGFDGMKVGGKRRLFIPWQLAYGATGRPGPDAAHPGIPPKADLIFDVELLDISDLPTPPNHPGMPPGMGGGARPMPGGMTPRPATPGSPAAPGTPAAPPAAKAPPAPGTQPAPSTPPPAPATMPAPPTSQTPPATPPPAAPPTTPPAPQPK
jgi:peptidylprolyl isomerase